MTVRSRSSGWMRLTQSSWVSFAASGGNPWMIRYSGERRFLKPSRKSTSTPPTRADTLDPRELRLALLQCAMGVVALAGNFLQMLAQPFGGRSLRQGRSTVSEGVIRAGNLLPALSHRNGELCQSSFALLHAWPDRQL